MATLQQAGATSPWFYLPPKEGDRRAMNSTLAVAKRHLRKHGVEAEVFEMDGPIFAAIHEGAVKAECELIIMGGYSQHPLLSPTNTLDEVLRISERPVLICR